MNAQMKSRKGVAAMLAMLYLVLFAVMAVGFYAGTTTSVQIPYNEKQVAIAGFAAESGMEFMRYQVSQIVIPYASQSDSDLLPQVYTQLSSVLSGTANMNGHPPDFSNGIITVPGGTNNYISVKSGGPQFRATIQSLGQKIRIKVVGRTPEGRFTRAVQLDYALAQRASNVFNYGVASRGKVYTGGSAIVQGATDPMKGSILSATADPMPIVIDGKIVSGDLSCTNPNGIIQYSGAQIAGTYNVNDIAANHVHKGVPAPEFPTIDTSAFAKYATNTYDKSMGSVLTNVRVPANTNPTFNGGTQIRGVLYVETPNKVTFNGNLDIQGVVVVQTENATGDYNSNSLNFSGGISSSGIDTLPDSFGDLRKLTGSFVLAPRFTVGFTGNFGLVKGHIIADKASFDGSASGTIQGSVITLADTQTTIKGTADVVIASTGTMNYPAGVYFSAYYTPLPDTYEEVKP